MRSLIYILLVLIFTSISASAQHLKQFNNGIFKEIEQTKEIKKQPVYISEFNYQPDNISRSSILQTARKNPGIAFAASALVPGAGQAINGKWVRAGVYFTAEVVGVIYHLDRNATARRQEKAYEEFTHQNWSVVAYAQWIVQYSDANNIDQPRLDELRNMVYSNGRPISPAWGNTTEDWNKVNIALLNSIENNTPFIFEDPPGCTPDECRRESNFSHILPAYGSQQYYELVSKYYQFQPGWKDWYSSITNNPNQHPSLYQYMWNGQDQPNTLFFEGRDRAEEFNQNYRMAGNILKLLLVNHVVSAFDALFTVQLKNSRIETDTNLLRLNQFSVTWHF